MYFGKSLGRVGADFSALVPHVFQVRMYDLVRSHLERGLETFEKSLRADMFKQQDSNTTSLMLDISPPDLQDITSTPPSALLVFPFVAALTNTFLSAFNELRHCALLALRHQLLDVVLRNVLFRTVQVLVEFKQEQTQALYKRNNELRFKYLLKILHVQFIPYVVTCYGHVWGTRDENRQLKRDCAALIDTVLLKMKNASLI